MLANVLFFSFCAGIHKHMLGSNNMVAKSTQFSIICYLPLLPFVEQTSHDKHLCGRRVLDTVATSLAIKERRRAPAVRRAKLGALGEVALLLRF